MAELKFEVLFRAIDNMSATMKKIQDNFKTLDEQVERTKKLKETGETMVKTGAMMAGAGAAGLYAMKEGFINPAAEMQGVMAHVATAMNDGALQAQHLAEVQERARQISQNSVISAEQLAEGYYLARSAGASHQQALINIAAANKLVIGTTDNAAAAQAAFAENARTVTELGNVYGANVGKITDQLALLQTKYSFRNIEEIRNALKFIAPSAAAAHVPLETLSGMLGILSANMLHAGMGGSSLRNILIAFEKGGSRERLMPFRIPDAKGNLDFMKSVMSLLQYASKLKPLAAEKFLTDAGFQARALGGIQIMLGHYKQMQAIQGDMANAADAAGKAEATRMSAADEQEAIFANRMHELRVSIGETLLPAFIKLVKIFGDLVVRATAFVDKHKALVASIMKWAAIGSALLIVGGILTAIAGAFLILSAFVTTFGGAIALAFAGIFPIIGIVAVGVYEIYKHWATIGPVVKSATSEVGRFALASESATRTGLSSLGSFVLKLESAIHTFFTELIPEAFHWGVNLIEEFGKGIESKLGDIGTKLKSVGDTIMSYMPWHSPAATGPLAQLPRVHIVESIAEMIRPEPIALAMNRAMLPALGVLGGVSSPAFTGSLAHAPLSQTKGATNITINLHYSPMMNGAESAGFDVKKHGDAMLKYLENNQWRINRLRFDRE